MFLVINKVQAQLHTNKQSNTVTHITKTYRPPGSYKYE